MTVISNYLTNNQCSLLNPFRPSQNICPVNGIVPLSLPKYLADFAKVGYIYTQDGLNMCQSPHHVAPSQSLCEQAVAKSALPKKRGLLSSIDSLPFAPIMEWVQNRRLNFK